MKNILIVEDEENLRKSLGNRLNMRGYNCVLAKDGIQALRILSLLKCDLVITAHRMVKLDGEVLVKTMAKDDNLRAIPVICLTWDFSVSAKQFSLPVTILQKPINFQGLLQTLHALLNS